MKTPYLLNLLTAPWAIQPEVLVQLQDLYAAHMRAEKIDVAAVEAQLGRPLANEQRRYELREGGVAVYEVEGVMAPKANIFMQVSGGISTAMMTQQFAGMRADPRVKAVVFAPASPGGNVIGVPEAARELQALAAEKPVVTVATGALASAMYWVGSAANAIFVHGETDPAGSLGVYSRIGWDPANPNAIEMVRGKYKRASINGNAPDPEVIAHYEGQMDYLYALLVDTVAEHRGVSSEQVLEHMAEGRVFYGQQAIDAGLVDGVSTVEAMVEQLATDPGRYAKRRKATFALGAPDIQSASAGDAPQDDPPATEKGSVMPEASDKTVVSRESLERDHPSLFAQLRTDFRAEGAAAELARVKGVLAEGEGLRGHEALVRTLALDGKTTPAEAAQAILAADRKALADAQAAHKADAPPAAPPAASPSQPAGGEKTRAQLAEEARAYAQEHNVSFVVACQKLGIQH